jgi:hypothetical protein
MREAVEKKVLSENDRLAAVQRQRYRDEGILCVNLVSSPGSGKTALLEKTLETFPKDSLSARTGEGLDLWMAWLGALQQKVQHQAAAAIT